MGRFGVSLPGSFAGSAAPSLGGSFFSPGVCAASVNGREAKKNIKNLRMAGRCLELLVTHCLGVRKPRVQPGEQNIREPRALTGVTLGVECFFCPLASG